MNINIRKAELSDFDTFIHLVCSLADYEMLPRPDSEAIERLRSHGFADNARFDPWIAEYDGNPVGYAIIFETYSSFLAKPTLYLEDLFLLPDYRKLGIGKRLFQKLAAEAKRRDCGRIEWVCLDWNETGLGFYERLGASRLTGWVPFRVTEAEFDTLL